MSRGWSGTEVENTSAVDIPIHLQSQQSLLSKQFLCEAQPETHQSFSFMHIIDKSGLDQRHASEYMR